MQLRGTSLPPFVLVELATVTVAKGPGCELQIVVYLVHADQDGNLAVSPSCLGSGNNNSLIRELWNDLPKGKGEGRTDGHRQDQRREPAAC